MNECRESLIDFSRYYVLKNGVVLSKFKKSAMTVNNLASGYVVNTYRKKDGKQETFARHRVIWVYFNGNIPKGMEIDHIDGNRKNNRLDNLRLCTRKENMANPITKERMNKAYKNEERNKKIAQSNIGRIVSEEQKRKQSQSMKGKYLGIKRPNHSNIMKTKPRDNCGRWIKT